MVETTSPFESVAETVTTEVAVAEAIAVRLEATDVSAEVAEGDEVTLDRTADTALVTD